MADVISHMTSCKWQHTLYNNMVHWIFSHVWLCDKETLCRHNIHKLVVSQHSCKIHWLRTNNEMYDFSMMTSSNGNIFRVTGLLCGEFIGHRWKRPVTRSFGVFFGLRLNKQLSKPSWGWWFETPSRSLWRQCNVPGPIQRYRAGLIVS